MKQQTYTSRRAVSRSASLAASNMTRQAMGANGWSRNYNTVRHTPKTLGSISNAAIVGLLVLIVGLIYVAQGTQATNYDYQLSEIESEISDLQAKKEDLAVEKARLTSIAASENSTVAASMSDATVGGYAE